MNAHLDISNELWLGLLTEGTHHNFSVSPGLPEGVQIDDVTYNPLTRTIRLHFDRPVPEPVLHAHSELPTK